MAIDIPRVDYKKKGSKKKASQKDHDEADKRNRELLERITKQKADELAKKGQDGR